MECSRNKGASPYSYHTFFFPFRWEHNDSDARKHDMDLFNKCLQDGKWACSKDEPRLIGYMAENYRFRLSDNDLDDNQKILLAYNEYKYFHVSARIAIYGEGVGKDIVHNYFRRFENGHESHILIRKGNIEYLLHVNSISLKVYNTGVAIFLLQTEYYGDKMVNNKQMRAPSFDDVLAINQYGRRICPPFIARDAENYCPELADRITLIIDGKEVIENFDSVLSNPDRYLNYISKIIMEILGKNFCFERESESPVGSRRVPVFAGLFSARKREKKKKRIYIEPIIDDRMFVISVVRDNQLIEYMQMWPNSENQYFFEKDAFADNSLKLYQFMFVDTESPSCADRRMRLDLIKQHCYSRWVEEGTLYGITHQAFVCLTDETDFGKNVITAHVLTLYTQMLALVLAQRASFVQFNNETSQISHDWPNETTDLEVFKYKVDSLIGLQERYHSFQGRVMNFEVTAQEQGIEMYKMMQQALYIREEAEELDGQLNLVQNMASTIMGRKHELVLMILTVLGILIGAVSLEEFFFTSAFIVLLLIGICVSFNGKLRIGFGILVSLMWVIKFFIRFYPHLFEPYIARLVKILAVLR